MENRSTSKFLTLKNFKLYGKLVHHFIQFYHWHSQCHMHFYRGGQGSYKQYEVVGKSSVRTEYSQIVSIVTLSVPRITKTKPMANPRGNGGFYIQSQHSWMSDKPQKYTTTKAAWITFSHQYLPEAYSYCVIVKMCLECVQLCGINGIKVTV